MQKTQKQNATTGLRTCNNILAMTQVTIMRTSYILWVCTSLWSCARVDNLYACLDISAIALEITLIYRG